MSMSTTVLHNEKTDRLFLCLSGKIINTKSLLSEELCPGSFFSI